MVGVIEGAARRYGAHHRAVRARAFEQLMWPESTARILDLGGGDGSHFGTYFPRFENVVIADILPERLARAETTSGYETVLLVECESRLPFADEEFDIVYCSSVIEHVTGPKEWAHNCTSRREFTATATRHQRQFAAEIARIGKGYWVQTPYRYFPIEPHSWLPPPVIWMPRTFCRTVNRYWIRPALWDFRPLTIGDMRLLFPGASIYRERSLAFVKSITAYRPPRPRNE